MPNMHKLLLPSKKRKRLRCIQTSFAFHSFAHKYAFTPDLMAAADGAAAARLQLLFVDLSGFACVCACVRREEEWSQKAPSARARFFTHSCLHILLCQLCVHCALLCCTTPTDDLEIWRDRAAQHEIPKHWWNVPLLGFYKTLIYLFIKKK